MAPAPRRANRATAHGRPRRAAAGRRRPGSRDWRSTGSCSRSSFPSFAPRKGAAAPRSHLAFAPRWCSLARARSVNDKIVKNIRKHGVAPVFPFWARGRGAMAVSDHVDFPTFMEGVKKRSEEHTSELQSLMRISYAVFCLKQKTSKDTTTV